MRILVSGATGNVGKAVIEQLVLAVETKESLQATKVDAASIQIFPGVRDPEKSQALFDSKYVTCVKFDFENVEMMQQALDSTGCQVLFLLRPPQLANVPKYFQPLIDQAIARKETLRHIVFLSVQGADTNKHIPHAKIEQAIIASNINYTFLRPAYFMQNFLQTPIFDELVVQPEHRIFLPAGSAKFTIIDISDIGRAAAGVLTSISSDEVTHLNKAYDLTNNEKLSFVEMAQILNDELPYDVRYESPSPVRFYFVVRRRYPQLPNMYIGIMIMLHYLPRFQSEPPPTNANEIAELCATNEGNITRHELTTFRKFVRQHKEQLSGDSISGGVSP